VGIDFGAGSVGMNTEVIEKLAERKVDPITKMVDLLEQTDDPELKFKILKELASYTVPKLRSTEVRVSGQVNHGIALLKFQDVNPARAAQIMMSGAQVAQAGMSTTLEAAASKRLQGEQTTQLDRDVMAAVKKFANPSGAMIEHLRREGEKELPKNIVGEVITEPILEGDGHVLPYEDFDADETGEIIDAVAAALGRSTAG